MSRARPSVVALALALVAMLAPSMARAHHSTCEHPSCPTFAPNFDAGDPIQVTDVSSDIMFRSTQQDHGMPVIGIEYLVPKGWRLSFANLREAEVTEPVAGGPGVGALATRCTEVFVGDNGDEVPATLGRTEVLGESTGMIVHTDTTRNFQLRTRTQPSPARFGAAGGAHALTFLRRDGDTAHLCWYMTTRDARLDHRDELGNTTDAKWASSREILLPLTFSRVPAGDPMADGFSWRMRLDMSSLYRDPFLRQQAVSVLSQTLFVRGLSIGNWTGERIIVSRTPVAAGRYEFRSAFETCARGLAATTAPDICKDGTRVSVTRSFPIDVRPPQTGIAHEFGRLTGPATAGMPKGTAIIHGTTRATITWTQPPPVNPTHRVRGYVLAVANPGDVDNQYLQRIVVDAADASFDERRPCGPDGRAEKCSLGLDFPLATTAGTLLHPDGKYSVGLVTIYEDGHRTDGRCDDGTVDGARCASSASEFHIVSPGVSVVQFLIHDDHFPFAYVTVPIDPGPDLPTYVPAFQVLLVDFIKKQAEMVVWNGLAPATIYAGRTSTIAGDPTTGGLVSFGSSRGVGGADFRFDGIVAGTQALGTFVRYDLKGAPKLGGQPTFSHEPFRGVRL